MVSFRSIFTAALAATTATAVVTSSQAIANIQTLTAKSQALQAPAQSITLVNGPLIIIGQGPFPTIIAGFADIITFTTAAVAAMQGTGKFPANEVGAVADAFREFVRVHQVLLNILIGKAGLFTIVPFIGQPVAQVLRSLEAIVDTVAFGLIAMLENAANDASTQADQLHVTIESAIGSYEGLSTGKLSLSPISRVKRALIAAY